MKDFLKNWGGVMLTLFLFAVVLMPLAVGADGTGSPNCPPNTLCNPLGGVKSFCQLIINILNAVMVLGIPVAILFIVWAGFRFVFAQGNATELAKARQNFLYVVIGLAIFVGASLITTIIIHTIEGLGVTGLNSCVPL